MELAPLRVKHFTNPGDVVATLAGLKGAHGFSGRKFIFAQHLNVPSQYYPGATHGTTADGDPSKMVTMNNYMWNMIKPLIEYQPYIHSAEEYTGQHIDIDLDVIREKVFVNMPNGQIQGWVMFAYPDLSYDLSQPWIDVPEKLNTDEVLKQVQDKIIVNFTERYRNAHINYFFLRKFKHRLVFAGTDREYMLFCNAWQIDMPKLIINNFLELAYGIKNCKFLLSNQSMCWNIAEAVKSPRVLEVCRYAQNCMPWVGKDSYGYLHQTGVEHFVDRLLC